MSAQEKRRLPVWWMVGAVALIGVVMAASILPVKTDTHYYNLGGRSKTSRTQADLRSLASGIESYYVDHGAYPAWATGVEGANAHMPEDSPSFRIPTFRRKLSAFDPLYSLTTPVSYMTDYFSDPFVLHQKAIFGYFVPESRGAWILWSPGPDGDYDIDPRIDYNPAEMPHPSPALVDKTHDPTNGTFSDGDVWRAKR